MACSQCQLALHHPQLTIHPRPVTTPQTTRGPSRFSARPPRDCCCPATIRPTRTTPPLVGWLIYMYGVRCCRVHTCSHPRHQRLIDSASITLCRTAHHPAALTKKVDATTPRQTDWGGGITATTATRNPQRTRRRRRRRRHHLCPSHNTLIEPAAASWNRQSRRRADL
jgi:hypothetical protein